MAKRGADIQITKDGVGQVNPHGEASLGSQRATAAQLAKRKILAGRTTRPSARLAGGHTASPFKLVDPNIANGTAPQQAAFQIPPPSASSNSIFSFGSMNGNSGHSFANPFSQAAQTQAPPPAFPALGQPAQPAPPAQPSTSSSSLFAAQPIPGFFTAFGAQPQSADPTPSTLSAPTSSGQPPASASFTFGQTPSQKAAPSVFTKPSEHGNLFGAPKSTVDPIRGPDESTTAPLFPVAQVSQGATTQTPTAAKPASIFEQAQPQTGSSMFASFPPSTPSKNLFTNSQVPRSESASLFPAPPQPSSPAKATGATFNFNQASTPAQSTPAPSFFSQPNGPTAAAPAFPPAPSVKAPLFFSTTQPTNESAAPASTSIFGQSLQKQNSSSLFPSTPQASGLEQTSSASTVGKSPSDIEMSSPGNRSADTSLANGGSISTADAHPISNEIPADHGETSDLMPPSRPFGFSDEQFRQYVTAYRLRALDLSLKKVLKDGTDLSDPLPFYNAKRREILSAGGLSQPFFGIKRKDGELLHASNKRINNITSSSNGHVAYPALSAEPSSTKRKAEGSLTKEPVADGTMDGKRSRGNLSGPSVDTPSLSETSKLFANVANGGSRSPSKPAMPSTTPDHSPRKPSSQSFFQTSASAPSSQSSSDLSSGHPASSGAANVSGPPKFGNITGTGFMAQFGASAKKSAEKDAAARKAKQKAEEFDSEEDDEEEWEAKYAAEQEAKKSKAEEANKSGAFSFQVSKQDEAAVAKPSAVASSSFLKPPGGSNRFGGSLSPATTASSESVLAGWKPTGSGTSSPFSFSNPNSDAEGSKTGDADNEESDESDEDEAANELAKTSATKAAQAASGASAGRSLFDLIEYNADGTPKRDLSPAHLTDDQVTKTEAALNPFASTGNPFASSANPFASSGKSATPASNPFASATAGFKFAVSATINNNESSSTAQRSNAIESTDAQPQSTATESISTPARQFASLRDTTSSLGTSIFARKSLASQDPVASKETTNPAQTASPGDNTWKPESPIRFSDSTTAPTLSFTAPSPVKASEQKPLGGLFGSANSSSATSANPFAHLQSATQPTAGAGFGFGFGGPASKPGSLFTSAPSSTASLTPAIASLTDSRATSPGATTADSEADSAVGTGADDEPQAQLDLADSRLGEEDEDVLFAIKAKAHELPRSTDPPRQKQWVVRGVGQLRVLKHRTTHKTRVILRAEPAGKVVLNAALMAGMQYERSGAKSVVFGAATDAGTLSRWSVLVRSEDDANKLAATLQANKAI